MAAIFIDGEAGTTGLENRERLEARSDLELILLGDRRRDVDARREALNGADAVILCLPDDAAREAVAMIENPAVRVIDASTAFRVAPAGIIPAGWPVTVNAVSGYSGGGKAMIAEFESGEGAPPYRAYGLSLKHKHVPEITRHAGLERPVLFAPAVAAYRQG